MEQKQITCTIQNRKKKLDTISETEFNVTLKHSMCKGTNISPSKMGRENTLLPWLFSSGTADSANPETERWNIRTRRGSADLAAPSRCAASYRVVVGVQVRDKDGGDLGEGVVHPVPIVSAELPEGPLTAVQQQRLGRAAGGFRKQTLRTNRTEPKGKCTGKQI